MPTHTVRSSLWRSVLGGLRLRNVLFHPATWALMATVIGLGLGSMAGRFRVRYFKLLVGLLVGAAVLRVPSYIGVGLFLVLYSYPAALWIGDTNGLFILFLLALWLGRVALRHDPPPRRTYLDWAILAYVAALILACVHIETPEDLSQSWAVLRHLVTPIGMYFLLVNCARSERRLLFVTEMFLLGVTTVFFSVFMQRFFPGVRWLPSGYLSTAAGAASSDNMAGAIRLGGVYTHALLSDATAIAFVLRIYLSSYYRNNRWMQVYHWFFALLSMYVLSLTGNRGGLLVLAGGMTYFLWLFRRQYSPGRVLAGTAIVVALLVGSEFLLFRFETEGSLLGRLLRTQIIRGIPETRVGVWDAIWSRIVESPWIGHGLVYKLGGTLQGGMFFWPHNSYLFYAYIGGAFTLFSYLAICWRVTRRTWVGQGLSVQGISLPRGLTAVYHVAALQYLAGQMRTDHQRPDLQVYVMWAIFSLGILARDVWEQERQAAARTSAAPTPAADLRRVTAMSAEG